MQEHPEDWESMLPYAQCILRMAPMKALGGRCPYEVVTGLRPRLPAGLVGVAPVTHRSVDDYVSKLGVYLRGAHASVERATREAVAQQDGESGWASHE